MAKQLLADVKAVIGEYEKNVRQIKFDLPVADVYTNYFEYSIKKDSIFVKIGEKSFVQKCSSRIISAFQWVCGDYRLMCSPDVKDAVPIELIAVTYENNVKLGFVHDKITYALKSNDDNEMLRVLFFSKNLPSNVIDRVNSILNRLDENVLEEDKTLPAFDMHLEVHQFDSYILVDGVDYYELVENQRDINIFRDPLPKGKKLGKFEPVGMAKVTLVRDGTASKIYVGFKIGEDFSAVKVLGGSVVSEFKELTYLIQHGLEQEYV